MALPRSGLSRSLAYTALHDHGMPCEPSDVTALLEAYDAWLDGRKVVAGQTDLYTYAYDVYGKAETAETYIRKQIILERHDDRTTRPGAPWKLAFRQEFGPGNASSNVEWMTQGELISLWQEIGAALHLGGM